MSARPPKHSSALSILLVSGATFLTACTAASFPLKVSNVSASPDPAVGRIVTLSVEIQSRVDEHDVTLQIHLPNGVKLIAGDLVWYGQLSAREPYEHTVSLCALYPGDWRIYIRTYSLADGKTISIDTDTIHFISEQRTGQAVPGREYTIIQDTPAPVPSPTTPAPAPCSQ
jgi:hypothetical protein